VASVFRSRYVRGLIVFLCACAALLVGGLAVSLLVESTRGHGSSSGNVILFLGGFFLLVLSPAVFILGIVYWSLSRPGRRDADN